MTPEQVVLILGALVTLIGAITAATVTIINAIRGNKVAINQAADDNAIIAAGQNTKLDTIHILVNSRLTTALDYIETLVTQLKASGLTPKPAPDELPARTLPTTVVPPQP